METVEKKKVILSAMQPSGDPTLGNYLGAIKNWVKLQEDYNCLFCAADLHSITVRQEPKVLRERSVNVLKLFMAAGIDPEKSVLFLQSHVHEHAELAWVLSCNTQMGELSRMTQFKDKSQKHADNINAGLFTYPVLMAADILLYKADLVPVGNDQLQHLEIARDIAGRFNHYYGDTFTLPEPYVQKSGGRIMSLQSPENKMSKSDLNPNGFISLLDDTDTIIRKFKRAVTDSDNEIRYSPEKAGISNLLDIYSAVTGKTIEEAEKEFSGFGYGDFKLAVGEAVASCLKPVQDKYIELGKNPDYVKKVYTEGAEFASRLAQRTLSKVYKKVGFVAK